MNEVVISSTEARKQWRDILDMIQFDDKIIVVERYGKPIAVIMPYVDYQDIESLQSKP
jgi:prevent-host-death family protein